MRTLLKAIAWLIVAGLLAACNNKPDNVRTAEKANVKRDDSLNTQKSVTDSASVPSKQDAEFMVKATNGSQLEVVLGKLAESRSLSTPVKRFGAMMVRDHSGSEKELRGLAAAKRIILPDTLSNKEEKEINELQKKKGREFDRAYMDLMVKDHKDDLDEYRKASEHANDSEIRALALNTLRMLQLHLDSAEDVRNHTEQWSRQQLQSPPVNPQ